MPPFLVKKGRGAAACFSTHYCPTGHADYGVRSASTGALTGSPSSTTTRAVLRAAPVQRQQLQRWLKGLHCRSYGGNFRTMSCALWAVPWPKVPFPVSLSGL